MRKLTQQFTTTVLLAAGLGAAILFQACSHTNNSDRGSAPAEAVALAEETKTAAHGEHQAVADGSHSGSHGESHDGSHSESPGNHEHHHGTLEVPAEQPTPTVDLVAEPDPVGGWNIEVRTENWTFAPEKVNQESLTTEGHAHLYLNGEKLTRIYSQWYYHPSLPSGEHTLTVELNANGHEVLTHNNEPIEASVTVLVP